jgi:hypothetical protein
MSTPPPAHTCARHPKVQTYLTCASCGTPICPDCFVQTPVGMKCRDCGTVHNTALFTLTPTELLLGSLAGLVLGALGGVAAYYLRGMLLFGFFVALAYGRFAGTVVLRAAGRKLGLAMEILTGASIALGGLATLAAFALNTFRALPPAMRPADAQLVTLMLHDPYALVMLGLVTAAAVSRIRLVWGSWDL